MATLLNQSLRAARWRTFNQSSIGTLIAAAELDLPPGGSTHYLHAQGAFTAEVREPVLLTTPATPVLAPVAGPFTNTDTLVFDGRSIRLATAAAPLTRTTPFLPSRHGFLFANAFPRNVPHLTLELGGQTRGLFDAGMGLCGGMVYAALDYLATGARPGNTHAPMTGSLFDFLCQRLFDSFGGASGVLSYLHWMHPSRTTQDRARFMVLEQWPAIKASLDSGRPVPLALVLVASTDPFKLGRNHQVLACGYDLNGSSLALHLYDPNWPGRDDLHLQLDLAPQGPANARLSADGCEVLAFFRTTYQAATPPAAAGVPVSSPPPRRSLALGGKAWVEGNGHIGLLDLAPPRADGGFNGTLYGSSLQGRWAGQELEFVRTINPGYDQVWSGRLRSDGSLVGSFFERQGGFIQPGSYSWRAHSSLLLDGNGWLGELAPVDFFSNGDFSAQAYGAAVRGRWVAATRRLSFTRELGPGYQQEWTATCSFGLDFEGEFRERQQGALQATRYRWLARLGSAARDQVRVINHLGRTVTVRVHAPDDPSHLLALRVLTIPAGQQELFAIPLGLPLALSHVALVFDGTQHILAGHGDDVEVRANGTVVMA
jgi:hypothetical protein